MSIRHRVSWLSFRSFSSLPYEIYRLTAFCLSPARHAVDVDSTTQFIYFSLLSDLFDWEERCCCAAFVLLLIYSFFFKWDAKKSNTAQQSDDDSFFPHCTCTVMLLSILYRYFSTRTSWNRDDAALSTYRTMKIVSRQSPATLYTISADYF